MVSANDLCCVCVLFVVVCVVMCCVVCCLCGRLKRNTIAVSVLYVCMLCILCVLCIRVVVIVVVVVCVSVCLCVLYLFAFTRHRFHLCCFLLSFHFVSNYSRSRNHRPSAYTYM